jgi:hypothetical protein
MSLLSIDNAVRRVQETILKLLKDDIAYPMVDDILSRLVDLTQPNPYEFEGGPYDIPGESSMQINHKTTNSMLSDLSEYHLFTHVSDLLEIPYLSEAKQGTGSFDWSEVRGIMNGLFSRPMVSIPL